MNNNYEIKQHLKVCLERVIRTTTELEDKTLFVFNKPNVYKEDLEILEETILDLDSCKSTLLRIISIFKRNLTK